MLTITHYKEGLRIFKRKLLNKPIKKYSGNSKEICKQIIDDCWNGKYLQVSPGNFAEFYCRDFGIIVKHLLNLGYKKQVESTLKYALKIFKKHNKFTTTITPDKIPVDMFYPTPESLSYIVNSLVLLKNKKLIQEYKSFIEQQVQMIFENDFNQKTGLLRDDKHFSAMKDQALRRSSCYNNCFLALLSNNLNKLKLNNPFKKYNFKKTIKENFWNGSYFYDDLSHKRYIAGDANVFPFWCDIFTSKKMFNSVLDTIQRNGLDKPWPLRYTRSRIKAHEYFPVRFFSKNYEGNTVWMHLGSCFIDVVSKFNKQLTKYYLEQYKHVIQKHKNFLEVFNPDGTIYKTPFYKADESMSWCAIYLNLIHSK